VTDGIWLAHNGVLACGNPVSRNKSDTWHFVEFFLRPLLTERPATLLEQGFQRCLADLIGPSNRLALMQSDGRVVIINRRSGFEHRGIWFSNDYSFDLRRLSA
jgi:hypothetical protein